VLTHFPQELKGVVQFPISLCALPFACFPSNFKIR
jgi:hypothetical protein